MNPTITLSASCDVNGRGVLSFTARTTDSGEGIPLQLTVQLRDANGAYLAPFTGGDPLSREVYEVPNGSYTAEASDQDGETTTSAAAVVDCTIVANPDPGNNPTVPAGQLIASYCSRDIAGKRVRMYFDPATKDVAVTFTDDAACGLNDPAHPAADSVLYDQCDGTTRDRVYYRETDDAESVAEPNSTHCGYVAPDPDPDPDPDPTPDPVVGCMDELASNFNPLATQADNTLCRYAPNWQPLWHPDGIAVEVEPEPDMAYVTAQLYAGYPAGHPLATGRPQVLIGTLRATASPRTGVATLQLAPFLRRCVGALQSDGTRRLDLNSPTAQTEDLFVGYRVQVGTRTVARGYAVNSAASAAELEQVRTDQHPLSPFGRTLPRWAGYDYRVSTFSTDATGRLGLLETQPAESDPDTDWQEINLPCPRYGLPVAWLAPGGGFGYWVFSGKPLHSDEISEGQGYTEAGTGEARLSSRTGSRRALELYSGAYSQRVLVEGLRTLRRAVQAWYQPGGPGTEWVAISLKGGSFPAYREGRSRYETTIQFTEARPQYAQGQ